jgi:hypothetical protein
VNEYYPGQAMRISVTVQSLGVDVDPDTITAFTKDPAGTVTTYGSPVRDGVGLYHQDIVLSTGAAPGVWIVKWVTTGALATKDGVGFESFKVLPLQF